MASCIPHWGTLPQSPPFAGPPNWWDAAHYRWPGPNDPRWSGASGHGYAYGTGEDAEFRAVYSEGAGATPYYLYLNWVVNNDPSLDSPFDGVYVGFQRTGGQPIVLELTFNNSAPASDGLPATLTWYQGGAPLAADPQHMPIGGLSAGNTAPPLTSVPSGYWVRPANGTVPSNAWGFSIRIPVTTSGNDLSSNGVNLGGVGPGGSSFKFWYAIWIELPASNFAPFYWPRGADWGIDTNNNPAPPITSAWDDVAFGSGGACGNGISLAYSDIGNNVNDPNTGLPAPDEVLVSLNQPFPTNHFFAKPLNGGPSQVAANSIEARFFTANWGSQSTWGNWQFSTSGAPHDSPWQEIPFEKQPNDHYLNTAAIPVGAKGTIGFDWALPRADAVEYLGDPTTNPPTQPTKFPHNCMLVTLANYVPLPNPQPQTPPNASSATGNDFLNDSMYHNMSYTQASSFSANAMISTLGAPAARGIASGAPVPLFIFAEQRNMAPVLLPPRVVPTFKTLMRGAMSPIEIGGRGGVNPGLLIHHTVATVMYHVYRSTGLRVFRRGRWHTCCEQQTSFGYFVEHEGPVFGWKHDFVHADPRLGTRFPLKQAGGAFYQTSIPHGEALEFTTSVASIDRKPSLMVRLATPANVAPIATRPAVKGIGGIVARPLDGMAGRLSKLRLVSRFRW